MIPTIGAHETSIVLHNDAVVQGLSEVPFMQDVSRWGVLTIGTGARECPLHKSERLKSPAVCFAELRLVAGFQSQSGRHPASTNSTGTWPARSQWTGLAAIATTECAAAE